MFGKATARAAAQRARLEMQGFVGLSDEKLAEVGPWLRLVPIASVGWMAVGTLLASPALIWGLVPFAAAGALRRRHPFDALYNHGLRHLLGTRPLPLYGVPRRVASGVATTWIIATALVFSTGATTLGRVLGAIFVALALLPATTDFCIPAFIFGRLFGWPVGCTRPGAVK